MTKSRRSRPARPNRSRVTQFRKLRELIYICAEGATEEAYIKALFEYRYPELFAPKFLGRTGNRQSRKTSLVNLIDAARLEEKSWGRQRKSSGCIWIVCDVDQNSTHRGELERWIAINPEQHRIAMQSVSIEAWFLQHFENPKRPTESKEALKALRAEWRQYQKGCEIPKWLIDCTDNALKFESMFAKDRGNDLFPAVGVSQMPDLIVYLDARKVELTRK